MNVPHDISQVLDSALDVVPDRTAVTARSGSLTYSELDLLANRCARALRALGVRSGDRVAVSLPNDLAILGAFHGAMRLGVVWVGVNQSFAAAEIAYILEDSGARLLLCEQPTAQKLAESDARLSGLRVTTTEGPTDALGASSWPTVLDAQTDAPLGVSIDPLGPAAIAYTSGTTGYPKGAVHSQQSLLVPGAYLVTTRGYDQTLRKGDCFPLTIVNMVVLTTLLTAQARATAVIMDSLRARDIAAWIRREQVTVWNGPPALLYTMAHDDAIVRTDLGSLEEVWSGGAETPETVRSAFEEKFGVRVVGTYGLTEAPTMVAIESARREHRSGRSGLPLPHLDVTIRDQHGGILSDGEVGEICIGPRDNAGVRERLREAWGVAYSDREDPHEYRLMLGYWGNREQTAEVLRGGVLHTGDVGALDADGNLIVTDRLNLVLNRGGANVYPAEIERVVLGFQEVAACGVIGVPDDRLGQRIGMLVQFEAGADPDVNALLAGCRATMAEYKVPERVAVVASLPRNAMGKIDRRALAEIGRKLLEGAQGQVQA